MRNRLGFSLLIAAVAGACGNSVSKGGSGTGTGTGTGAGSGAGAGSGMGGSSDVGVGVGGMSSGTGGCGPDGPSPNEVLADTSDPAKGVFTMADALAELPPGPGPLRAIIDTDLGVLSCELASDKAPNGVANFVGLARGRRPWRDPTSSKWVKRRFYDGLLFHRVIPDFVAQGGDPLGTGFGGPGYKFADEIADLKHLPGTLAYANSGKNTNGSQFYIAEKALPSLDGKYVIFGQCAPVTLVTSLTHVPRDAKDKPTMDLHMKTVTITRCAP